MYHIINITLIVCLSAFTWVNVPSFIHSRVKRKKNRLRLTSKKEQQEKHEVNMRRIGSSLSTLDNHIRRVLTKENEKEKCQLY